MRHSIRWLTVTLLVLVGLPLAACQTAETTIQKIQPALVEAVEGTEFNRITLTEQAAQRLGIETAPVREEQVNGEQRMVVPYAAVIYDVEGNTWVYTNPEPLIFVRQAITIEFIEGDIAVLGDGPSAGTEVVTVGVSELYGTDTGVG